MKKTPLLIALLLLLITTNIKAQSLILRPTNPLNELKFEKFVPAVKGSTNPKDRAHIIFTLPDSNFRNGNIYHQYFYGMLITDNKDIGRMKNAVDYLEIKTPLETIPNGESTKRPHLKLYSSDIPYDFKYNHRNYPIVNQTVHYKQGHTNRINHIKVYFDQYFPLYITDYNSVKFEFFFLDEGLLGVIDGIYEVGNTETLVSKSLSSNLDTAPIVEINRTRKNNLYITEESFNDYNNTIELYSHVSVYDAQDGNIKNRLQIEIFPINNEVVRAEKLTEQELSDPNLKGRFLVKYCAKDTSGNLSNIEYFEIEKRTTIVEAYKTMEVNFIPATKEAKAYFEFTTQTNTDYNYSTDVTAVYDYMNFEIKEEDYYFTNRIEGYRAVSVKRSNKHNGEIFTMGSIENADEFLNQNYLIKAGERVWKKSRNTNFREENKYIIRLEVDKNYPLYNDIINNEEVALKFKHLQVEQKNRNQRKVTQESSVLKKLIFSDFEASKINSSPEIEINEDTRKKAFDKHQEITINELIEGVTAFDKQDGDISEKIEIVIKNRNKEIINSPSEIIKEGTYTIVYIVEDSSGNIKESEEFEITKGNANADLEKFGELIFVDKITDNTLTDEPTTYYTFKVKFSIDENQFSFGHTEYAEFIINPEFENLNTDITAVIKAKEDYLQENVVIYKKHQQNSTIKHMDLEYIDDNINNSNINNRFIYTKKYENGDNSHLYENEYYIHVKADSSFPIDKLMNLDGKVNFMFKTYKVGNSNNVSLNSESNILSLGKNL